MTLKKKPAKKGRAASAPGAEGDAFERSGYFSRAITLPSPAMKVDQFVGLFENVGLTPADAGLYPGGRVNTETNPSISTFANPTR